MCLLDRGFFVIWKFPYLQRFLFSLNYVKHRRHSDDLRSILEINVPTEYRMLLAVNPLVLDVY